MEQGIKISQRTADAIGLIKDFEALFTRISEVKKDIEDSIDGWLLGEKIGGLCSDLGGALIQMAADSAKQMLYQVADTDEGQPIEI